MGVRSHRGHPIKENRTKAEAQGRAMSIQEAVDYALTAIRNPERDQRLADCYCGGHSALVFY